MQTHHEFDALLLLATTLSSKRRPAELVEIMAAADVLGGVLPSETRLWEAFGRLAAKGLIREVDGGCTLTPAAQALMAGQHCNASTETRLAVLRERLTTWPADPAATPLILTVRQISAAILAHRVATQGGGKTCLMPKPKAPEGGKGPGQRQRKPLPARKHKN